MNKPFFEIRNASIGYDRPLCTYINATLRQGDLVGLIGRNGSGKTTLIKTILGLINKLSGEIHLEDDNMNLWKQQDYAKKISVVFSRLEQVPQIKVYDLVALGRLPYQQLFSKLTKEDHLKIHEILQIVGISELSTVDANVLSDGQLQMVMIARALVQDTNLILMDEPTSHLDIENQMKIMELIVNLSKETGKTFIISSHQIELLLENSTQIWWMDKGKFQAGFPEQIAYENQIFEKLSQEKIKFDYNLGRFRYVVEPKRKISVSHHSNPLNYWLIHALRRNGFEVSEESDLNIKVENETLILGKLKFEKIEDLLNYLNN